jgi:hypothetical protein
MAPRAATPAKAPGEEGFRWLFLVLDARQQLALVLIGRLIAPA